MRTSRKGLFVFCLVIAILTLAIIVQSQAYAKAIVYARPVVGAIDPHANWPGENGQNITLVYQSLVTQDRNANVIPELAESWEASPNYKDFTFHLRKGVKFHDGTPFNAQAVKFSFDRMLKLKLVPYGNYLGYADQNSCEVVDDYTLKIHLIKPLPIFVVDLASLVYSVVSPSYVKQHATADDPDAQKWMSDHACGTGPFKLVDLKPGEKAVFEKFVEYWGGTKGGKTTPKVDSIIYQVVKDPSTAALLLEKGDVDIAEKLTIEQFASLEKVKGTKVVNYLTPAIVYLTMDVSKPPFDDLKVRQAISHAINYDEIIDKIERGTGKRLRGIFPEGIPGYDAKMPLCKFDVAKANELMKTSKYPNGFTTNLIYAQGRKAEFEQVATYMQAYLKKIGIIVNLQQIAFQTQLSMMEKGNYGLSLMRWHVSQPDPDDPAGWLYDSSRGEAVGWNGTHWDDKDVQTKLAKARETADMKERVKLYQEVDQKAVDQAIYTYLYQMATPYAMRDNIKNFWYDTFLFVYFWDTEKQ